MTNCIRVLTDFKIGLAVFLLLATVSTALVADPIHDAVIQRDRQLLDSLIDEGVNLNRLDEFGFAALHWAVRDNQRATVEALIEAGANVNVRSARRETPLHLAVFREYVPIINILLENGASVDVANSNGDTPLHIASAATNVRITELLIESGATTTRTNSAGKRAVDLFEQNSPQRVIVNEGLLRDGYNTLSYINLIGSSILLVGAGTLTLTLFDASGNSPLLSDTGVNDDEVQDIYATLLGMDAVGVVGLAYGLVERIVNGSLYSQVDDRDQDEETRRILTDRYYNALFANSIVYSSIGGVSALILMVTDVLDAPFIPVFFASPAFWFLGVGVAGLFLAESTVIRTALAPILSNPIALLPKPNGLEVLIRY